ncbi:MAG: hypothetical protein U0670_04175 [Anaerolineae bacterium]
MSTNENEVRNQREIKIVEDGAPKAKSPIEEFVDHQRKALEETGKAIESLLPEGFREHGKEAGKEFAKGLKILVDAAIGEMEKAGREIDKQFKQSRQSSSTPGEVDGSDRPSSTGATKVKVQVD